MRWMVLTVGLVVAASLSSCAATPQAASTTSRPEQPGPRSTPAGLATPMPDVGGGTFYVGTGAGSRRLAPVPRSGRLVIAYSCDLAGATIRFVRSPDVDVTSKCVRGSVGRISFAANEQKSARSVEVRTASDVSWQVALGVHP
jgi:hypothetical protein